MRVVFTIFLMVHGLIHLLGFAKAFKLGDLAEFTSEISKSMGLLWLSTGLLFTATAVLYFKKKDLWPFAVILIVLLSQVLIITVWPDAKYATWANIIILVTSLPAYGEYRFTKKVQNEAVALLKHEESRREQWITKEAIDRLPKMVQKWMEFSGVIDMPETITVRLKQKGKMRRKADGKWMPYVAQQYFNLIDPSFVWMTSVKSNQLVHHKGRDKLTDGHGEMLIKLWSLFPVVHEKNNSKVDAASMQRYLAEICWFPSAALNGYIRWEEIDDKSVRAVMTVAGESVSGVFRFSSEGQMLSFETERYYGGGRDAKMETWVITLLECKEFDTRIIPYRSEVTWQLESGDFTWLQVEITDLEYNTDRLWSRL